MISSRASIVPVALSLILAFAAEANAEHPIVEFDIPPQSLASALVAYGEQASVSVMFSDELVRDQTTDGIRGAHPIDQALLALLAGTMLQAQWVAERTVALRSTESVGERKEVSSRSVEPDQRRGRKPTIEEIVVTSRKREELLQDVPLTVNAFDAATMADLQIDSITDLNEAVPNLVFNEAGGLASGLQNMSIRGVGAPAGFEKGVAIYLDDVYIASEQAQLLDAIDIQQIEVLKGPQGHLYGRNTTGGAIKFTTVRPTDTLTGNAEISLGNHRSSFAKVSISGPLLEETLLARATVARRKRDGFQKDVITRDDYWGEDLTIFRTSLLWTPLDALTVDLTYNYTQNDGPGRAPNHTYPGRDQWRTNVLLLGEVLPAPFTPVSFYPASLVDAPDSAYGDEDRVSTNLDMSDFKNRSQWYGATFHWEINESWSIKSITAHVATETNLIFDTDATRFALVDYLQDRNSSQFSQEFQLHYSSDRANLVAGLYYLDNEQKSDFPESYSQVRSPYFNVPGDPAAFPLILRQNRYPDELETKSYAAYAGLDFDITERLSVDLGLRYSIESKELSFAGYDLMTFPGLFVSGGGTTLLFDGSQPGAVPFLESLLGPALIASCSIDPTFTTPPSQCSMMVPTEPYFPDNKWRDTTGRVGLSFRATENLMLYGYWASGFRAGGFNRTPNPAYVTYEPEKVRTYAMGIKSTLLDSRVRINAEAFLNELDDMQFQNWITSPTGIVSIIGNFGKAETSGVDVEVTWLPPVPGLLLNLGVGYLHSEITRATGIPTDAFGSPIGSTPTDISDNLKMARAPRWSINAGGSYEFTLGGYGSIRITTNYAWSDDTPVVMPYVKNAVRLDRSVIQGDHGIWNASIAFYSPDERWRIAIEGKNLTDKRVAIDAYDLTRNVAIGYNSPRTVLVSAQYRWGQ